MDITDKETAVTTAEEELAKAQDKYAKAVAADGRFKMARLQGAQKTAVNNWLSATDDTITDQIQKLQNALQEKLKRESITVPVISGANAPDEETGETAPGTTAAQAGSELADPIFQLDAPAGGAAARSNTNDAADANPWTNISFSYSATDQAAEASSSSWGMSVGGSVGFGLWSVGGNYSHDESKEDMQSDMAKCDVSISFSALVVNVNRPWLYGELFTDFDLEVARGVDLSPEPAKLKPLIENQTPDQPPAQIDKYTTFPAYPTSFIVAADTTIEFNGSTQHIEKHFSSHSNSGGVSVGYGPWSVSSSFHESASKQAMQMHVTATGCKLSFGAPQVIGWVSQILPPLPREVDYQPLTQGATVPIPT